MLNDFTGDLLEQQSQIDPERVELMAEIARLYYEEGETQSAIGKKFHLSKATVSRILDEARRHKIVEIIIHYPISTDCNLEKQLIEKYGLIGAHVLVSGQRPYINLVRLLGKLAARVMLNYINDGMTIAVSWGMAVSATVEALSVNRPMHLRVVQTQGSSEEDIIEGTNVVRTLAAMFGNDFRIIPAPFILKDQRIAQVLREEPSVCEALQIAENADLALVGIGSMNPKVSGLFRAGYLDDQQLQELIQQGAMGDVCGVIIDKNGQPLDVEFNRRIIVVDLAKLRDIPIVIGVGAGAEKAPGILAALRGGYIKVLVTDMMAAKYLLSQDEL
ncbi:MAG: hypothetical protein DDG59_03460 [Anaerolineae bacterium]|jgi:DNA-binding transcriptional regulator LsrR (DeoR family)|nr:MAG: hypothetical protein DDG59_03460 [Anaerolineae bacterium]